MIEELENHVATGEQEQLAPRSSSFGWLAKPDSDCDGSWEVILEDEFSRIILVANGLEEQTARLIAAAPELLATLTELADLMQGVIDGDYKPDSFTLQPAQNAIAKATGEK